MYELTNLFVLRFPNFDTIELLYGRGHGRYRYTLRPRPDRNR